MSVVIPTFNRRDTLRRAVTSALDQTHEHIEIVVSDNASTDGSLETIRDLGQDSRLRILQSATNRGPIPNWHKALAATSGEYVKVVWSDDWMEPDTIDELLGPLLMDSSVGFTVCPQVIHFPDQLSVSISEPAGRIVFNDLLDSHAGIRSLPVSPGAALVKRQDAIWGVECSFGKRHSQCRNRAIGPDLLMLYGALRRGEWGRWVPNTQVHFDASSDSISVTEESNRLRTCYSLALAYLGTETNSARDRIVLRQLLVLRSLKRGWSDDADPQEVAALLSQLAAGSDARDWVAGSTIALSKSARYVVHRLQRTIKQRVAGDR